MKKMIAMLLALSLMLSVAACGAKEPVSVDLEAMYESFGPYLPEMYFMDEVTLLNFLGVDVADCAQYKIALCAEGMDADEIWLIEAKDDAALEKLQQLAETRIEAKLGEAAFYVPDQYAIIEKAEVVVIGRYIALLVSPDVDTLKATFEAAFQ